MAPKPRFGVLLRMEPLDLLTIAVSPAEAASKAGLKSRLRIAMHGGRAEGPTGGVPPYL